MTDVQAPTLALRDINKGFAGIPVLKEVSCSFFPGEVHCLMGENGAGKSTLIKIISGAHRPDGGSIEFEGRVVEAYGPGWARAHGIATIYQELDLIPNLSVAENISLGNEPRTGLGRIDSAVLEHRAAETLAKMGVSLDVRAAVGDFGIANQQMVAIAKAIAFQCRLLVLDEPTAVFTKAEKDTLFQLVRSMRSEGIAIIFISHHIEEIFEIGDRITVLRDGVVASSGMVADYDHDTLVRHMVGRNIERVAKRRPGGERPRVLDVKGLSDGGLVQDVSFHVDAGEIVGVAGLVGAGRSEMAAALFGASRRTAGTVTLNGRAIAPKSPAEALRLKIGMVPEDRKRDGLALTRPAGENLSYSYICKASRGGLIPWGRVRSAIRDAFSELVVRPGRPLMQAGRMSGGNQQKLVLGRWLIAGSDMLILDEPTRGVDIGARAEIYQAMDGLRENGLAILMISSDLTEILSQSDRILVMSKGRLAGELTAEEATEEAILAMALRNYGVAAA